MAGKHVGREHLRRVQAREGKVLRIQHHKVRLLSHGQPGNGTARGLRSALQCLQGHGRGDLWLLARCQHVALPQAQTLAVFKQQQLFGGVDGGMAVRTHAPRSAMGQPARQVKNTVPQIGLGAGTNPGHRTAACGTGIFGLIHVRGMHQTPTGVDIGMVEQPLHRTLTTPCQAGLDFCGLLGNVDMHWRFAIHSGEAGHCFLQTLGRHCAQGMRRQPQTGALCITHGLQAFQQTQHVVGATDETALTISGRGRAKSAALIKNRQQCQADAGVLCGAQQAQRQRRIIRIGPPIRVVVHIVKFANGGVASLQHFDIKPGRNRFELLRCDALGKPVHQRAPAPEAVLRLPTVFGKAGEGALESVGVEIGHAGDKRPLSRLHGCIRAAIGLHLRETARRIPLQQNIFLPACGQQCVSGEKGGVHRSS